MNLRSEKRKKINRFLPLTSLIKRKLRTFHVVVLQQMQRNEQKHVMYVRSCCFAAQMRVSPFTSSKLIYPSMVLDGGSMEKANSRSLLTGIPKSERSRQKINILQESINKFYSFSSTNFITGQRMWIKRQRFPKNCIKKGIKYFISLKRKMSTHTCAPLLPFSNFFSFFKYHPGRTFTSDSSWCV